MNILKKILVVSTAFGLYTATAVESRAVDNPTVFQVTAPSSQSSSDIKINHKSVNGQPNAVLIVTQCWKGVYNPHPVGVYYETTSKSWYIFNEDEADIPPKTIFNVRAEATPTATSVHLNASALNSSANYTITSGLTTSASGLILVTHYMDPAPSIGAMYLTVNLGLYYLGDEWVVFNVDGSNAEATAYNLADVTGAAGASLQTSTSSNISSDNFAINDPIANGNAKAIVFVSNNGTPPGAAESDNNHGVGVYYNGSNWCIFNEDETAMATGLAYNVQVFAGPVTP